MLNKITKLVLALLVLILIITAAFKSENPLQTLIDNKDKLLETTQEIDETIEEIEEEKIFDNWIIDYNTAETDQEKIEVLESVPTVTID